MTSERQLAMAQALCHLPRESLGVAFKAWLRGDKSHLSEYEAAHTRVGVFFPKPAELIAIAEIHAAQQRHYRASQEVIEGHRRMERDRELHPERYVHMRDILAEFIEKQGTKIPKAPQGVTCPHCNSALPDRNGAVSNLKPAELRLLADAIERRATEKASSETA